MKNKFGKSIAQYAPFNKVRIIGLKICGCSIGKDVYVGQDLIIISSLGRNVEISIGDRVSIAPRVTLITSSHPNNSKILDNLQVSEGRISIKKDAWIGTNVVIMPNVTIGERTAVGAMSFVNKTLPDFTICFGNPAKPIRNL